MRGPNHERRILTLNSGSSSLKFSLYEMQQDAEALLVRGKIDRIGAGAGKFTATDGENEKAVDESVSVPDHQGALDLLLDRLPSLGCDSVAAVGHRIVQGGPHHTRPEIVTAALLEELEALCPIDPPHLPAALKALRAAEKLGPDLPQVACFDTAFHRGMPAVAQGLPLPRELTESSTLIRYGFHGLSYEYIISQLSRIAGPEAARGKVIIAHLGNGASMAALCNGRSIETTMGFTPAGGLVMSSRSGDLDPGVIAYLLRERKIAPDKLSEFVFQQCGLKGVSGLSSDIRDLLAARETNPHAKMAVDLFCYQARKSLGALVAVLDGVDTIIFTGGIGENASFPRANICEGLRHLGLEIDARHNEQNQEIISSPASRVIVRVIRTNEELVIARHTARLAFPVTHQPGENP
jgi:acetate kinase